MSGLDFNVSVSRRLRGSPVIGLRLNELYNAKVELTNELKRFEMENETGMVGYIDGQLSVINMMIDTYLEL